MKVEALLANLPRKEIFRSDSLTPHSITLHDSPLVRIFARENFGSIHDGIDIFISLYLGKRPETKGLDFGWRRRSLEELLEREKEHYKTYIDSESEKEE
jgi:hypothetical protein